MLKTYPFQSHYFFLFFLFTYLLKIYGEAGGSKFNAHYFIDFFTAAQRDTGQDEIIQVNQTTARAVEFL